MDSPQTTAAPKWFKPVNIVAVIWNLLGLMAFGMTMALTPESMAEAGMPEAQQQLMNSTPAWVNAAFAVAVICGTLGSVALLMRKKLAVPILGLSLVGVVAQQTWIYFLSDTIKIMGVGLSPLVLLIAIALFVLALHANKRQWFANTAA